MKLGKPVLGLADECNPVHFSFRIWNIVWDHVQFRVRSQVWGRVRTRVWAVVGGPIKAAVKSKRKELA